MGLTVKALIEDLGGTTDGLDPERENAIVLFETDDGNFRGVEGTNFHRHGPPDFESEVPLMVLDDGGEVEVE